MADLKQISFFDNGAAMQSMRSSGFDANSAYGEIIDNSIQAEAKDIKIYFDYDSSDKYERISSIAFADDGIGMSKEIIHQCLQLGYSSRFNDRAGIGRFGVGATLAAINQCKQVEIYSKERGKNWFYTYIDIDEIASDPPEMKNIPDPKEKSPPAEYGNIVSKEQGTLVIWSKYDKQDGKATEIIKEFKIWAGRTYRKFIWNDFNIYINYECVFAIDPLYLKTEKTKFPDDPKAEDRDPIVFSWPIPDSDLRSSSKEIESTVTIKMSCLPEAFRATQGAGGSAETKERYIHLNEGVSILRNKREVFYGHIPHFKFRFKEVDRWWGCEICFDAVLDNEFSVKNIKRGATPTKELRSAISSKILPTRRTILDEVQRHWSVSKITKASSGGIDSGHAEAEDVAKKTPLSKSKIDEGKNISAEIDEHIKKSNVLRDANSREQAKWGAKFKSQPFTIYEDCWNGDNFFNTAHLGGNSILNYNTSHVFIMEVIEMMEKVEERVINKKEFENLKFMIDLLVMSFSRAEADFNKEAEMNVEIFLDQLKRQWGSFLSSYTKTMINEKLKS